MTNLSFVIEIKNTGKAAGTLSWILDFLKSGQLEIKRTKDGSPGMFFREDFDSNGNKREKPVYHFICKAADQKFYSDIPMMERWKINGVDYISVFPEFTGNPEDLTFTDYKLTPAAKAKVEEFIYEAVHTFAKWFEQN